MNEFGGDWFKLKGKKNIWNIKVYIQRSYPSHVLGIYLCIYVLSKNRFLRIYLPQNKMYIYNNINHAFFN